MSDGLHALGPEAVLEPAPAPGAAAPGCEQTGLKALVVIARNMGLDWSLPRLLHLYGRDAEPDAEQLMRAARTEGMSVAVHQVDWPRLARFAKLAPFLARLRSGAYVIVQQLAPGDKLVIFNPRAPQARLFPIAREDFLAHWTGEILLFKRSYKLADAERRFDLGWFIPEFWKQRALLRNILIAALAMHVLALAVPIFFQIVIDRVLIYLSLSTLIVVGAGVAAAILFNSIFSWLRGYFILRVASRIDIRLSQLTFRHLMRLPISFFDQARAGVVTRKP